MGVLGLNPGTAGEYVKKTVTSGWACYPNPSFLFGNRLVGAGCAGYVAGSETLNPKP
jgi:hypothetical protein